MQKENERKGIEMNYADIKKFDIANGPGVRLSLFVSGCTHHCKNCFNQEAWDFSYGHPFTEEVQASLIDELGKSYYSGLTLLGGEPMEPQNQHALLPFLREIKKRYPQKNIWCFTGYLFDRDLLGKMADSCPDTQEILRYIDILVDGPFVENEKKDDLLFKGSANQRTICVQESLSSGRIVLWNPKEYVHVEVNENPSGGII